MAGPVRTARPARRLPLAMAAALVLVLGGALLTLFLANRPGGSPPGTVVAEGRGAAQVRAISAAKGPPMHYDLPDGSRLTLEGGSTVEVVYASARRDLRLVQGRAHFDVAHDTSRPFTVRAGDRAVVAVGTQFDVRLDPGRVRVVLTEGRVAVSRTADKGPPTMLRAGQQLDAATGRDPVVSPADLDGSRDWREGVVTFDDTPLAVAVADLNRTSADQLVVRDPQIARLRISGRFQTGDSARFGRTLAQVHPVRVVETAPHRFEIVAAR
jgi:transmembrane sensor